MVIETKSDALLGHFHRFDELEKFIEAWNVVNE
jgi:hypothetical protein